MLRNDWNGAKSPQPRTHGLPPVTTSYLAWRWPPAQQGEGLNGTRFSKNRNASSDPISFFQVFDVLLMKTILPVFLRRCDSLPHKPTLCTATREQGGKERWQGPRPEADSSEGAQRRSGTTAGPETWGWQLRGCPASSGTAAGPVPGHSPRTVPGHSPEANSSEGAQLTAQRVPSELWSRPRGEEKLQTTGKMFLLCPSPRRARWPMLERPGQPASPSPARTMELILLEAIPKHVRNRRVTRNRWYGSPMASHPWSAQLPHATARLRKRRLDNQGGQKPPAQAAGSSQRLGTQLPARDEQSSRWVHTGPTPRHTFIDHPRNDRAQPRHRQMTRTHIRPTTEL